MNVSMLYKSVLFLVTFLCFSIFANIQHISSSSTNQTDAVNVWIFFTDKPYYGLSKNLIGKRAHSRRLAAGFNENRLEDQQVYTGYIDAVVSNGGILRHTFKWDNAASFEIPAWRLPLIKKLACVKSVTLVGKTVVKPVAETGGLLRKTLKVMDYGKLYDKVSRLNIPQAHRYLGYVNHGDEPGKGVLVAVFDNGFQLDHRSFKHLHKRSAIVAKYDFVEKDTNVYNADTHGSAVLGLIAAYDPPLYCGAAWGVDLLLAKTESDDYELHSEEDNWVAALVWAEEHGADVISSSVGYRDFDSGDTVIIDRGNGVFDTIESYAKTDLDGKTTVISRAAAGAVARGVIIVNAVGNEHDIWGDTSLSAPADVDGVVAVGALNNKNIIESYSSTGPAADGRIKPDLVAPGEDVNVPLFNSVNDTGYSLTTSGTSIATPLVTGIFALARQQHPSLTSEQLRQKVYKFCRLLPKQSKIDNVYGRGIPDAVRSCMLSEDEIFIIASETENTALAGASVENMDGKTLAITDSSGVALFSVLPAAITQLVISKQNKKRIIAPGVTPLCMELHPCSLLVNVMDVNNIPLSGSVVNYVLNGMTQTCITDSSGYAVITDFFPSIVSVHISKPGYCWSDTTSVELHEQITTRKVVLKNVDAGIVVYPSILRRSHGGKLMVQFAAQNSIRVSSEKKLSLSVRSLNGALVWKQNVMTNGSPMVFTWEGTNPGGARVAPGIYFLTLLFDGKKYLQKFIIAE